MLRTSLIIPLASLLLLRQTLCSCAPDEPCEYEVVPLATDAETLWDTTPAQDIAELEIPQHGIWSWGESEIFIELDDAGVSLPAWATFVHDPGTIRYSEHVGGGHGVACNGPTVSVDGNLTITDEQGAVIISVLLTASRQHTAGFEYGSSPQYSPTSLFSDRVHETQEWDMSQVFGKIIWLEQHGLLAEFFYHAQSMDPELTASGTVTGDGVISRVGTFEADGPP